MKYLITISFLLLSFLIFAQDSNTRQSIVDTVVSPQNIVVHRDSLHKDSAKTATFPAVRQNDSLVKLSTAQNISDSLRDSLRRDTVEANIHTAVVKKPVPKNVVHLMDGTRRIVPDKDIIFFILVFLIFLLGLIRTSFPKYFDSIFSLSFQATFRQTQTKEQMAQNFFPAFMLNVLFVLCGGLFITMYAEFNHWTSLPFWQLFIYSTSILLVIYLVKYLVISFTGWVFNAKEAATEYRFVVFLINKLLAVLLIPLLFLIAYSNAEIKNIAVTIVICLAVFSLAMRYLFSLARIRKNLSITAFHFFIYLCAVEIMPLLVIYKLLFLQTGNR